MNESTNPLEDDISKWLRLNSQKIIVACYLIINCLVVIGEYIQPLSLAGPGYGLTLLFVAVPVSLIISVIYFVLFLTDMKRYRNELIINTLGTLSLLLILPVYYGIASIFK